MQGSVTKRAWFSPGGNARLWGEGKTYTVVPYEALPALPSRAGAMFEWLDRAAEVEDALQVRSNDEEELTGDDLESWMAALEEETAPLGVTVPPSFQRFMTDPRLHARVPTCTACYLDLPERLVEPPGGEGLLVRFLNDQQCCFLWYLRLFAGGKHDVVCARPEFIEDPEGESLDDAVVLHDLTVCAPSFEDFIHRFWIENTLWYANREKRALTRDEQAYVDAAKR
jgi:hypothetical protein